MADHAKILSESPGSDAPRAGAAPGSAIAAVDVLILACNERVNLPHALRSVIGWANRVVVVDSGSTDGTQQIARDLGAQVVEHPWEGYARQKNWALDTVGFTSPWIFILDSDEAVTPDLRDEVLALLRRPPSSIPEDGFYVNRYLVFMGHRIRHCGYFPSWNLRLFKRGKARYEDRLVHEHMVLEGKEGYLKGLMSHEDRRGLEYYIAKHNQYSTLEAQVIFQATRERDHAGRLELRPSIFGTAIHRRRYFKNHIYPKLPARWLGRLLWMYVLNLGFLDGIPGLRFCLFISSHELFTAMKVTELQLQAREKEKTAAAGAPPDAQPAHLTNGNGAALPVRDAARTSLPADEGSDLQGSRAARVATPTGEQSARERLRSPWGLWDKTLRVVWMIVRAVLFRPSFHNWYAWRRWLLRCFGAKIGRGVCVRPTARIEIPQNLEIGDYAAVGDYAILYSLGKITIGRLAVVSQYAHLCAGTHDYTDRTFPLIRPPINIGEEAWVAADAFVGPGVTIGARAVVGARATVMRDVEPGMVVVGNPARCVKRRMPNIPAAPAVAATDPALPADAVAAAHSTNGAE
ncbi:MAG TPA: WcaF family extracellular polysaccharide biosynthesis acetyltransferase [Tepidisphaeraceae bacterium]|nr:WcaF family extracellular polysaccharide biosynthesis acetyltransferase [Tepidisphaeraceae bacterium]